MEKIQITDNELIGLAFALRITTSIKERSEEAFKSIGDSVKAEHKAVCNTLDIIETLFWHGVRDFYPQINDYKSAMCFDDDDNVFIKISDNKHENSNKCDEVANLDSLLDSIGLETADEHVERLANDLRKGKGGQA